MLLGHSFHWVRLRMSTTSLENVSKRKFVSCRGSCSKLQKKVFTGNHENFKNLGNLVAKCLDILWFLVDSVER